MPSARPRLVLPVYAGQHPRTLLAMRKVQAMTTKPAPVDVELLQRLSDAATAGPWRPDPGEYRLYIWGGDGHMIADHIDDEPYEPEGKGALVRIRGVGCRDQRRPDERERNHDLIIAMRNALPQLLADLRLARGLLETFKEENSQLRAERDALRAERDTINEELVALRDLLESYEAR